MRAVGEGGYRRWDGWMASPTQWTWVWAGSARWWRTRKPGMLQSLGSERVGHNGATEQQQQKCVTQGCGNSPFYHEHSSNVTPLNNTNVRHYVHVKKKW